MTPPRQPCTRRSEQGFTLIEALIAMVIMSFGLIAITNLFIVAAASNSIANHSTSAASAASEVMERLKGIDYPLLAGATGGTLAMDTTDPTDRPACIDNPAGPAPPGINDCVFPGSFQAVKAEQGVGEIWIRWTIVNPGAAGPDTLFITVRAQSAGALTGQRSRAEFTTFRTCTTQGCP